MIIFVKTLYGKLVKIEVEPNATIEDIKDKVYIKEGYPIDRQDYIFAGKKLENEKKLEDYGIIEESTLHMILYKQGCRLPPIYINYDGKETEKRICICHGVKYVKEQIEKQFKIKPEFQELRLNGQILEDENNKNVLKDLKSYSKIELINIKPKDNFRKYYDIIEEPIGIGGFGKVYKAKEKETNKEKAIKIFDKNEIKKEFFSNNFYEMTEKDMKLYIIRFENEIKYMKIMEGQNKENINTVKFYEHFHTEKEFVIVMELCDGNLTNLFKKKKKNECFNIEEIYNILTQLNNSFKLMNENKIIHRDLKLENILIKYIDIENTKYIVKLTDYGISRQLLDATHLSTKIGTPKFMAPEILEENNNYNEECDLWSLGVIIYILSFKKYPYDCQANQGILNLIKNNEQKFFKEAENKELNDLIHKLLIKDPIKRMNWNQYFNHSFFKNRIKTINKKYNEINLIVTIEKEDINKDIYFLDNSDGYYTNNGKYRDRNMNGYCEINESIVDVYINNQKYKCKKYFKPENEGLYEIKLIFNNYISDCSFMFSFCENITYINLTYFNSENVSDMSYMFSNCYNLRNINFSSIDTKNVANMSHMFYNCHSITNLNLSSFDTEYVTNMSYMFSNCYNIRDINLSSFDTEYVTNMSYMFSNCYNIKDINLSSFDTKNVTNMSYMFFSTISLKSVVIQKERENPSLIELIKKEKKMLLYK